MFFFKDSANTRTYTYCRPLSLHDAIPVFFGKTDGDWGLLTYDFDEIVATLNSVHRFDWTTLLDTRLRQPGQPAPLRGIEMAGYRLTRSEEHTSELQSTMRI